MAYFFSRMYFQFVCCRHLLLKLLFYGLSSSVRTSFDISVLVGGVLCWLPGCEEGTCTAWEGSAFPSPASRSLLICKENWLNSMTPKDFHSFEILLSASLYKLRSVVINYSNGSQMVRSRWQTVRNTLMVMSSLIKHYLLLSGTVILDLLFMQVLHTSHFQLHVIQVTKFKYHV